MTGLIVSVTVSLARPKHYSWETTRSINSSANPMMCNSDNPTKADSSSQPGPRKSLAEDDEKQAIADGIVEDEPSSLRGAFKVACIASFLLTFLMDFLIPIPMFLSHYVFSQAFFTAWVIITFIWVFCSAAITTVLPLLEAAGFLKALAQQMMRR